MKKKTLFIILIVPFLSFFASFTVYSSLNNTQNETESTQNMGNQYVKPEISEDEYIEVPEITTKEWFEYIHYEYEQS